jgi:hypothetical protein
MKMRNAAVAAAALCGAAWCGATGVNRCTLPDGRTVYTDAACPNSAASAARVGRPPPVAPAQSAATRPTPAARGGVAETIAWTGSPAIDAPRAVAIIEAALVRGRDCEWVIKVTRSDYSACDDFTGRVRPEGEAYQAAQRLRDITADPAAERALRAELRRGLRGLQEMVRLQEFVQRSR